MTSLYKELDRVRVKNRVRYNQLMTKLTPSTVAVVRNKIKAGKQDVRAILKEVLNDKV